MLIWRNEAIRTIYVTPGQDLVSEEAQALRREFQSWSGNRTERLVLDLARVEHWVNNGAQLTDKVRNLLKEATKTQAAA